MPAGTGAAVASMTQIVKVVRFFASAQASLPAPPLVQLLSQVLAAPAGATGPDLAEWWMAVGRPGNFCRALGSLEADGWIEQRPDGRWRATAKAWATCVVAVDEVPERHPGEDDQAWAARAREWTAAPPPYTLQ